MKVRRNSSKVREKYVDSCVTETKGREGGKHYWQWPDAEVSNKMKTEKCV